MRDIPDRDRTGARARLDSSSARVQHGVAMIQRNQRRIAKSDWICAVTLTVLAALPRLCCLNLAEFKLDEATHYQMAYHLMRGGWRWVGSTASVGFHKPPLFVYTLALPMQISHDPRVVTGFLGILAALATGGFFLIVRRFMGRGAAFGAALLFAANPQAILYSRKLFTADLIPPLCTLFLGAAILFLESSRRRVGLFAVLVAFAFALLLLNTFSPVLLFPAAVLLYWQRRQDLEPMHYLGAVLAFVLPFLPYLIYVAPQIPGAIAATGGPPAEHIPLLQWVWTLLYGAPWPSNTLTVAGIAATITTLLSLAGLVWLLDAAREPDSRPWAAFFLAWLVLAPLMALVVPIQVKAHYLIVLYPLLFMLPAAGTEWAFRRARWLGWSALALLIVIAGWQTQAWVGILRDVSRGVEGYGTPLGYWWHATERARALTSEHGAAEIILLLPGDQRWDEKAHILDALLDDTPHRVVNGYHTVLYPPHTAILLIASEVKDALTICTACTQNLGLPLPASPFGESYHYRLWSGDPSTASACAGGLRPASAQWASGARLLAYGVTGRPEPGATLHITLHWETPHGSPPEDVHWFNHLLDQEGHQWGQFDHASWPAAQWQPGDQVLTFFDITIDTQARPGPYVLRIGQYTYPDIENIPIVDADGNPLEHAVQLPLATR